MILEGIVLEPCPFCGVPPNFRADRLAQIDEIVCENGECPVKVRLQFHEHAREQGAEVWNTRAG